MSLKTERFHFFCVSFVHSLFKLKLNKNRETCRLGICCFDWPEGLCLRFRFLASWNVKLLSGDHDQPTSPNLPKVLGDATKSEKSDYNWISNRRTDVKKYNTGQEAKSWEFRLRLAYQLPRDTRNIVYEDCYKCTDV